MSNHTTLGKDEKAAPERVQQRAVTTPLVDVYEDKEGLLLIADLPGVTKDGVRIELEKGQLTIDARRADPPAGTLVASEYRAVDYHRVFSVPRDIDPAKIDASLTAGVLRLRLPKSDAAKPRRIEVRAG